MSPTKNWVVALGLGGEVLGVEHGAPPEWFGERLHERIGIPAALGDAARAVTRAARRGAALALARVEVPDLDATIELVVVPAAGLSRRATDVSALLRSSVAALERQARALDIAFSVTTSPDVPNALVLDPEKIAWAISALAGNAMRYARCGTRHMPGGRIAVSASCDADRGELVVVVQDDGPGIPAEVLARLFRGASSVPHATGLALTVVRDVVTAHGGSLELTTSTDEADSGTTVTLRLPLD